MSRFLSTGKRFSQNPLDILEGLRDILFRDAVPLGGFASLAHMRQLLRGLGRQADRGRTLIPA